MAGVMHRQQMEVFEAMERISKYCHRTPVMTCEYINQLVGRKVFFKCENFQKTGAFKVRGALNAVLKLKETDPGTRGVVTHSSGNHAQALGYASQTAGVACSVVVPNNTPQCKIDAIQGYGAELHFCEPNPTSRMEVCDKVSEAKQQVKISSYDNSDVVAGQGTIAVEFLQQVPQLDAIFASVSGGGMVAGISLAVKALKPHCKVYPVEPKGKNLAPSMQSGQRKWSNPPQYVDTIAEGIRVQQVGRLTFPIFLENVEKEVFTVDNEEIVAAMKLIWHRMKLVIESSAAATVAAVLSEKCKQLDPKIMNIGVVVCGGNVDLDDLPWVSSKK